MEGDAVFQLLFLAIIAAVVFAVVQRRHHGWSGSAMTTASDVPALPAEMERSLRAWSDAGLISPVERQAITDWELAERERARAVAPRRRIPAVAEALAYLGGILAATGVLLVLVQAWSDLNTALHLVITIVATTVLVVIGLAARDQTVAELIRLRAFVWLASTATAGALGSVLAIDVLGTDYPPTVVSFVAAAVLVHSVALWRGGDVPLEQLAAAGGLVVLVGSLVAPWTHEGGVGIAVWGVGVLLVAVGFERWGSHPLLTALAGTLSAVVGVMIAAPYFAQDAGIATGATVWAMGAVLILLGVTVVPQASVAALGLGSVATVVGAAIVAAQSQDAAPILGLINAMALLLLGTRPRLALVSVAGCVGLLVNVPWAVSHFFPGEARAPLLVSLSGLVILGVAWLLMRRRGRLQAALHGQDLPEGFADHRGRGMRHPDGPPAVTAP